MIAYHPGKANVVADALSRRKTSCACIKAKRLKVEGTWTIKHKASKTFLGTITVQSNMMEALLKAQERSIHLPKLLETLNKPDSDIVVVMDGCLRFRRRIWVPKDSEEKAQILAEAHKTKYTLHPGSTKMYKDLQKLFWWKSMKTDIEEFISKCLTCQ